MFERGLYILLLLFCTAVLAHEHNYSNELYLDPQENYQMFWSYSADTIRFKIRVATTGYVGFGLSSNGGMAGADIVVAWVKDGETFLYDMHGASSGNSVPLLDDHEDWVLIEGQEKDGITEITFGRNLITCDDEEDMDITVNTMRVIWSYSIHDPESISNLHQVQHTSLNRGARSVALLHSDTDGQQPSLPDNAYTYDVTMKNHNIHQSDTTYWCKTSRIGKNQQRDQIVAMEPLVQAGNEGVVHHFVLNTCIYQDPLPDDFEGDEFLCSENGGMDEEDLPYHPKCEQLVGIWAVGGGTYYFPENVGYKIGNVDEEVFYKLQVHYDNPDNRVDIIDSSGYRLWFSPTQREHDAGMLMFFANHNGFYNIPPHTDDFIVRHYCPTEVLDQAFEGSDTTEVNLLAYSLHAHVTGISARMRHFRNETEMDAYAYDETYDFNYQTFRMLDDVQLKKGDSIMVECNSKNPNDNPVYSGEGTNQEMCLVYIMYYPVLPFTSCGSEVLPLEQLQTVQPEITSFDYESNTVTSEGAFEGMSYEEVMDQATWDAGLIQQYQDLLLTNQMMAYIPEMGGIGGYYDVPSVPKEAKRAEVTCIEEVPAPEDTGLRGHRHDTSNAGPSVTTPLWMVFVTWISLLLMW